MPTLLVRARAAACTAAALLTLCSHVRTCFAFGANTRPSFGSIACHPYGTDGAVTCAHPDMSGVGSATLSCCDRMDTNSATHTAAAAYGPGRFNANRTKYTCKYGSSASGYRPCEIVPPSCVDVPGFKDAYGTCATYSANEWCDPTGATGIAWQSSWGALDARAASSCCRCGGGARRPMTPRPTPRHVPTSPPAVAHTAAACTVATGPRASCEGKAAGGFCGSHLARSARFGGKMSFPFYCKQATRPGRGPPEGPLVCKYCPFGPIETCGGNAKPKAACVFPFYYKGKLISSSSAVDSASGCTSQDTIIGPWCYTEATTAQGLEGKAAAAGQAREPEWGYCNPDSCTPQGNA